MLAEKENEVRQAWAEKATALALAHAEKATAQAEKATAQAEKATAQAEKAAAQAELEVTILRLQLKNMEALRLANSVNLRGAIGKCRVSHVSMELSLSHSPSPIIHYL